jgi:protein SCO1/2
MSLLRLALLPLVFGVAGNLFPGVGIEQRIGEKLPLDGAFRDDHGRTVRLGDLFARKPAVLIFGYSRCPQLCSIVADASVQALRQIRSTAGKDYVVIYASIDPTDGPLELAAMKRRDLTAYGRAAADDGWHYISGSETAVRRLARAAGFFYTYDAREKLYDHAAGLVVVTPGGRISRYFLGVEFSGKDLLSALRRAGEGKTGGSVFDLLLLCARGAGVAGKYGKLVWFVIQASVVATAAALFGGIGWMLWTERRAGGNGGLS